MAIQSARIHVRSSRAQGNSTPAPFEVRTLCLELEDAPPRKLYFESGANTDEINVLLQMAVVDKIGNVETEYTFDEENLVIGHEIDPYDPGTWTEQPGTRGVTYPITAQDGSTYHVGFSL